MAKKQTTVQEQMAEAVESQANRITELSAETIAEKLKKLEKMERDQRIGNKIKSISSMMVKTRKDGNVEQTAKYFAEIQGLRNGTINIDDVVVKEHKPAKLKTLAELEKAIERARNLVEKYQGMLDAGQYE